MRRSANSCLARIGQSRRTSRQEPQALRPGRNALGNLALSRLRALYSRSGRIRQLRFLPRALQSFAVRAHRTASCEMRRLPMHWPLPSAWRRHYRPAPRRRALVALSEETAKEKNVTICSGICLARPDSVWCAPIERPFMRLPPSRLNSRRGAQAPKVSEALQPEISNWLPTRSCGQGRPQTNCRHVLHCGSHNSMMRVYTHPNRPAQADF